MIDKSCPFGCFVYKDVPIYSEFGTFYILCKFGNLINTVRFDDFKLARQFVDSMIAAN